MPKDYIQLRYWRRSHIAFLTRLAEINKKRPIETPMSMIEFLDEVAHGRIKMPKV